MIGGVFEKKMMKSRVRKYDHAPSSRAYGKEENYHEYRNT